MQGHAAPGEYSDKPVGGIVEKRFAPLVGLTACVLDQTVPCHRHQANQTCQNALAHVQAPAKHGKTPIEKTNQL